MDRSMEFFGELKAYEEKIKKLNQDKEHLNPILLHLQEKKQKYILQQMKKALIEENYALIVEDIADFLDIDEKQVRANIIPKLDYIRAPEGAADFFSIEHNVEMNFLEMRIKKWKRLFIKKESFETFLKQHLIMYCPYTKIRWDEQKGKYTAIGTGETPIPYCEGFKPNFVRKCNIAHIIRQKKQDDLIRKTKNDITHAKMLGLISSERLTEEMALLSQNKYQLNVPVHNQEIKNYTEKTLHYKFHLYKEEEDKDKPLYTSKLKDTLDKAIKPTVLYWFIDTI